MSDPAPSPTPGPTEHEGLILVGTSRNLGAPAGVGLLEARFVRYPGCQQLTLWLPQPGHLGYGALRRFGPAGRVLEELPLHERLNGSVQILWDTLAWPAGAYRIEIDHVEGWHHELALQKLPPHVEAPAPPPPAEVAPSAPIAYRDGLGRPIPDADLALRREAFLALQRRFSRRMEYDGSYRAGTMTYVDGERRIAFAHEMGGGGLKFCVELPSEAEWQARTGTPLAERAEIVQFVAERVRRDQGVARFEIRADGIYFYGA
jgi:hypothetical protein